MCKLLKVGRSSYYEWLQKKDQVCEKKNEIKQLIEEIYFESKQRYGSPRICKELKIRGIEVSQPTVAKYMREMGLRSKIGKKVKKTTDSNHNLPVAPNILNRDFSAGEPNQKWVSDISYIPVKEGFIYLTVILDLYDRKVVGWSVSDNLETRHTVLAAWNNCSEKLEKNGLFHSDRGVQYASNLFCNVLNSNDIIQSMSRKGNCWDNAVAESFFKTLKSEMLYGMKKLLADEMRKQLWEYIEMWYNRQRRHSTLGLLTIAEFNESI